MKNKLSTLVFLVFSGALVAQVGINTDTPNPSAMLDVVSTNKGFLAPRINLLTNTMQLGTAINAAGLLVYNTGTSLPVGYYFWSGSEWRNIDNSTAVAPTITSLNCAAATLSPGSYTSGVAYNGYLRVPYEGGNGGKYQSGSSVTVNGITFKLLADKLQFGNGELVFSANGIPTVSSPAATNVIINQSLVPFITSAEQCTATVGEQYSADVKDVAVMGPLVLSGNEGGIIYYHQYLTTSDGKFSIRVKIEQGYTYAASDIQIRSNIGPVTLMYNYDTEYQASDINGAGNEFILPAGGIWYGNGGVGGDTTGTTGLGTAWGDPDVYYVYPERRRYTWTTTNTSDKTMYEAIIMLGAPTSGEVANTTNCPGGICKNTKAYIIIKQVKAQ